MAKRLAVLLGTLALLVLAVGLPTAVAQQAQYGGGEVSATGYLSPVYPAGAYSHLLNDEATGRQYLVRSGAVDLGAYDDGQQVTVSGTLVSGGDAEPVLEVTNVEEPSDTGEPGAAATLSFELAVEGEPPADATFFGNIQTGEGGPGIFVPLTDGDGDGVYTGSTSISDRFPPGLRPLPPDAEPLALPVRIVQGTGTNPNAQSEVPGEPITVLEDFGAAPLQEENIYSTSFLFEGDTSVGETTPINEGETTMIDEGETPTVHESDPTAGEDLNEDGVVDEADGEYAAQTSDAAAESGPEGRTLPNTGGLALVLLAGALLAGGGFLVRRILR